MLDITYIDIKYRQSHTPRNCFTNNEDYGNHIAELTK